MKKIMFKERSISLLILLVSLIFLLFLSCASFSFGEIQGSENEKVSGKKVVLVVINSIGIDDFTAKDTPNLYHLSDRTGAVGLMNCRSAGATNAINNYLTIGSGVKAAGGLWGGLAFNTNEEYSMEKAGDIYQSRTGIKPPANGVVNLSIADVSRQSRKYKLDIYPGSLGKALKEAGLKVGVIGNADTFEEFQEVPPFHREVSLIAMDHLGRVPFGNVDRTLTSEESKSIGGFKTNYYALFHEAKRLIAKVDFLVIETGDTARVDESADFLLDWEIPRKKTEALKETDKFVGKLMDEIDFNNSLLIVLSPTPSKRMQFQGNLLCPIIVRGKGISSGVLTSPTTRRHGIIDNTDIAPTVISFLGGEIPYYMSGRPLSGESQSDATKYLGAQLQQILIKTKIRVPVLTTYITSVTTILLLSLVIILLGEKGKRFLKLFQLLLVWSISVPLAMLISAAFSYSSSSESVIAALAISLVLVIISKLFRSNYLFPILFLSLLTCLALVIDTITGAHLMKRSLLGYCPIIGARFYGIGNEYMGVLIGSSIVGLTMLFDIYNLRNKLSLTVVGLVFAFIIMVIGYQGFGANIGGTVAAVAAFVITFVGIWQGKISLKHLLFVIGAIVVAISILVLADLVVKAGDSHLGRSIELIKQGGFGEAVRIIQRKLAMNIKGTRYTSWTRILIATIVVLPILFLRPVGAFARISEKYPLLTPGLIGSAFGAIFAFAFNDTGAAVAATIIVFSVVATLYIIIEEQRIKALAESI